MRKIQLDEPVVIEMYERVENTREVAESFGVCDETIRRVLKRHNIQRTHRHDDEKKSKGHNLPCGAKKNCPALVVMLYRCDDMSNSEIAEATGYTTASVCSVLNKHGIRRIQRKCAADFDLDAIEHEYTVLGIPGRQLDEKYDLPEGTVCKWMRKRGVRAGKGAHQSGASKPELQERHKCAETEFATRLHDEFGGRFEYVGGFRENGRKFATVRCTECGTEFEHYARYYGSEWVCPTCSNTERERANRRKADEQEARRYQLMFAELREFTVAKTCVECGSTFQSSSPNAKYCCDACKRRVSNRRKNPRRIGNGGCFRHYYHVKYGDGYRDYYDPSVTLAALYERDDGVCQICGKPCDWNDKTWGQNGPLYPSVDHIIARANGGAHHWDNVQLAHCICNSVKRDLTNDEAIAYVS